MFKMTVRNIILIGVLCLPLNLYIIHMALLNADNGWISNTCQFIVAYCFACFSTKKILNLLLKDEE